MTKEESKIRLYGALSGWVAMSGVNLLADGYTFNGIVNIGVAVVVFYTTNLYSYSR